MKLKTYRAPSMAEVLAAVKKDLGRSAVILHTRTVKSGGFLGLRRRTVVEVTAADEPPAAMRRSAPAPPHAGAFSPVYPEPAAALQSRRSVSSAAAVDFYTRTPGNPAPAVPRAAQSAAEAPAAEVPTPPAAKPVTVSPAPAPEPAIMTVRPRPATVAPTLEVPLRSESLSNDAGRIRRELSDIKLLVHQVLQASAPALSDPGCGRMPEALFRHYLRLLESQVSRDIADRLVGAVRDELGAGELGDEEVVRAAVLRRLAAMIPVAEAPRPTRSLDGRPFVVALVGPTGVGKTTTIAKLAASYRLRQGRSVALVTADTYRIAAVDQLRTYASIIGLPLKVVLTPGEMGAAVDALSHHDVILIDTAGRSQRNTERLSELGAFLQAARPTETHLVLSSASAQDVLLAAAESFGVLCPNRIILTKLDEAVNFGVVVNIMQRLRTQLSFVTTGQEVPDQIEPGRADRLARMILDPEPPPGHECRTGEGFVGAGSGRSGMEMPGWRSEPTSSLPAGVQA